MMNRWYERDKKRMEADLLTARQERDTLRERLSTMEQQHRDVASELQLYKREDARRCTKLANANVHVVQVSIILLVLNLSLSLSRFGITTYIKVECTRQLVNDDRSFQT